MCRYFSHFWISGSFPDPCLSSRSRSRRISISLPPAALEFLFLSTRRDGMVVRQGAPCRRQVPTADFRWQFRQVFPWNGERFRAERLETSLKQRENPSWNSFNETLLSTLQRAPFSSTIFLGNLAGKKWPSNPATREDRYRFLSSPSVFSRNWEATGTSANARSWIAPLKQTSLTVFPRRLAAMQLKSWRNRGYSDYC